MAATPSPAAALELVRPGPEHARGLASIGAAAFADPWPEAGLRVELERPMTRALAARFEGRLAGYALGWRVLDELQLLHLAVSPDLRRRGIGRALLDAYLDGLRREGVRRGTLEVRESNLFARRLYERAGFSCEGRRTRYYRDGEDAVLYGMELA